MPRSMLCPHQDDHVRKMLGGIARSATKVARVCLLLFTSFLTPCFTQEFITARAQSFAQTSATGRASIVSSNTPAVYCVMFQRELSGMAPRRNPTGICSEAPFRPTLELALRLH